MSDRGNRLDDIAAEGRIIREARELASHVETLLDALESFYMNGSADDVSGDVEASCGHFYRVARWIVQTDSQGFHDVSAYADDDKAREAFATLDDRYSQWFDSDD